MIDWGSFNYRKLSFQLWWHRKKQIWAKFHVVPLGLLALGIIIVFFPWFRDWANDNVGAMTAAATTVAGIYAWITLDLTSQSRELTLISQEQLASQSLPVISFKIGPNPRLNKFSLEIENIGPGPALNVSFSFLPPNCVLGNRGMTEVLSSAPIH